MLRFPDVSADEIVFVYAGDLWIVPKAGGAARRLSSPKGQEMLPKFSPDGSLIAFSGNYDGNTDVYTIPAQGGTPTRLTHHPEADQRRRVVSRRQEHPLSLHDEQPLAAVQPVLQAAGRGRPARGAAAGVRRAGQLQPRRACGWRFSSSRASSARGSATRAAWPAICGSTISSTTPRRNSRISPARTRCPCGTRTRSTSCPTATGRRSSTSGPTTCGRRRTRQVTKFTEYDVKWPSIGPDAIVFENGGVLHLLDLATETSQAPEHPGALRSAPDSGGAEERLQSDRELVALAQRQAGALRGPRRGLHRSGKARQRAEPDQHLRRGRARSAPGRPTARTSRTSPTRRASTSCTCVRATARARKSRSPRAARRSATGPSGRPTARRSRSATRRAACSSSMSRAARSSSSTRTSGIEHAVLLLVARQPVADLRQARGQSQRQRS